MNDGIGTHEFDQRIRPRDDRTLLPGSRDVPSDFVFLQVKITSLPLTAMANRGVFSRQKIEAGTVICELRGSFVEPGSDLGENWDRTVDTRHGTLLEAGICSIINDCRQAASGECWPDARLNSELIIDENSGKALIVSNTIIESGEEIFYDYGSGYWEHWRLRMGV